MTIQAIEIMTRDEAVEFRSRVERLEFVDGAASAGRARDIKQNTQARGANDETGELVAGLIERLDKNRTLRRSAFPRDYARVSFNRYGPGDHYGMHVDAAWIGQPGSKHRSDLSFTLFLSDPDEYEGGELQIADGLGSPRVKLAAGRMVVYPTRHLHAVTPVTSGVRYAAIGWIESWIGDADLREIVARTQSLETLLESQPIPAATKMMMHEISEGLKRYGSR